MRHQRFEEERIDAQSGRFVLGHGIAKARAEHDGQVCTDVP
jgi:hypothetical protein